MRLKPLYAERALHIPAGSGANGLLHFFFRAAGRVLWLTASHGTRTRLDATNMRLKRSTPSLPCTWGSGRERAAAPADEGGTAGDRRAAFQFLYGVVVDNVNVSVLLYVPVRSGSLALTSCLNAIATLSLETGAVQLALPSSTRSGSASANAPLVR